MEKEFNQAIANKIEQLAKQLKADAAADFVSNYRDSGMTQADAEQLANDYVLFYLSQEVYLKAAKNVSKHIVK